MPVRFADVEGHARPIMSRGAFGNSGVSPCLREKDETLMRSRPRDRLLGSGRFDTCLGNVFLLGTMNSSPDATRARS